MLIGEPKHIDGASGAEEAAASASAHAWKLPNDVQANQLRI